MTGKELIMYILQMINTKTKKHIVGGILLSTSIFLGSLAATVITSKIEDRHDKLKGD